MCTGDSEVSLLSWSSENRRGHGHRQDRGAGLAPMNMREKEGKDCAQATGFGNQEDDGIIQGEKQA